MNAHNIPELMQALGQHAKTASAAMAKASAAHKSAALKQLALLLRLATPRAPQRPGAARLHALCGAAAVRVPRMPFGDGQVMYGCWTVVSCLATLRRRPPRRRCSAHCTCNA